MKNKPVLEHADDGIRPHGLHQLRLRQRLAMAFEQHEQRIERP